MTEAALVPASDTADAPILHVLFVVDGTTFALPANIVLQMESFSGATSVPGAPPWVTGIVQLRGRVIPVVEAMVRAALEQKQLVARREGTATAA